MSPKTYSSWCFVSRGFVRYSSGGMLCHNLLVASIFRNSHFPACTAVDMQHFTAVLAPYSLHQFLKEAWTPNVIWYLRGGPRRFGELPADIPGVSPKVFSTRLKRLAQDWIFERMNCVQNQETIANKHLLKNKVAAFIIMGGQDNVQGVAGQLMTFWAEVGCQFPQFPFIAHARGWSAEDMERNVGEVQHSRELREAAQQLVTRAADMVKLTVAGQIPEHRLAGGGRKAHKLDSEPTG
jgi:hypothetical protein